jgi:hypothetical protein
LKQRRTIALAIALFALAGCSVPGPGAAPQPAAAPDVVPAGMPYIDMSRLPAPAAGAGDARVGPVAASPPLGFAHDRVGAFRTFCAQSHMLADDPIVAPGRPGGSHLHTFFGNTGANASSTADSIQNTGNSTCRGGVLNRSAYWVPSVIDTATGAPVSSSGMLIYYKSGYSGVAPSAITSPPLGLRMIAGSAAASPGAPQVQQPGQLSPYAAWSCGTKQANRTAGIPTGCPPGSPIYAEVRFPQCWDGLNLDSPDHMSHMAYATWGPVAGQNGAGCPASHPVAIPEITMFVEYVVPNGGAGTWRLSSDNYAGPGGFSLHGDWYNGWERSTLDQWVGACARSIDCQVDFLGNGNRLL